MRLNREKIAAALAFVFLLGGLYHVAVGIITPKRDIVIPDTTLPQIRREVPRPRLPEFASATVPERNLFRFTEGWRALETLPLAPPPATAPSHIVPMLGSGVIGGEAGFLYVESLPQETGVRRGSGTSSGASKTGTSKTGTSKTDTSKTGTSKTDTSKTGTSKTGTSETSGPSPSSQGGSR